MPISTEALPCCTGPGGLLVALVSHKGQDIFLQKDHSTNKSPSQFSTRVGRKRERERLFAIPCQSIPVYTPHCVGAWRVNMPRLESLAASASREGN